LDKLSLVRKTLEMSKNIKSDFFSEAESTFYTDILMLDILLSELDCMDSICALMEREKFADCFILLRHVFETFLYFWLMVEGQIYKFTRVFYVTPNPGSTASAARDRTYDKWKIEWKSGLSQYRDVSEIAKGKEDNVIRITYRWKGVFSSKDPKDAERIVPWYVFAFQDYDPNTRFLSDLPSLSRLPYPSYREIMKRRQMEQKMLYHSYFYIDSIVKNLLLNGLVSDEQVDRIKVHYNFFSNFVHPNKRIIRTRTSGFGFSFPSNETQILSELVLLYLCKLQQLYLSRIVSHFRKQYPKGKYAEFESQAASLGTSSSELWFFDNQPTEYDVYTSDARKWWLKSGGETVDEKLVFYYTDPIERLTNLMAWHSRGTSPLP
jgi:hypothetical protein